MMLERAVHMRRSIGFFIDGQRDLSHLALTMSEWDQCEALLKILYPFKLESTRIQSTETPTINRVYWSYERMFNEIDEMKSKLNKELAKVRRKEIDWMRQLEHAIGEMEKKLKDYYGKSVHYVFPEAVLLDPTTKTTLFDARSFTGDATDWKRKYIDDTRDRFQANYATIEISDTGSVVTVPTKRKWDDDEEDDFKRRIVDHASNRLENELDRYLATPVAHEVRPLDWWRKNQHEYPRLARMVRDVYAVPASGAGVEREFSKSGRVANWTRSRLSPTTIAESMMYKSYLVREGQTLQELEDDGEASDGEGEEEHNIQRLSREFSRQYSLNSQ
jgi:hypothetical protein